MPNNKDVEEWMRWGYTKDTWYLAVDIYRDILNPRWPVSCPWEALPDEVKKQLCALAQALLSGEIKLPGFHKKTEGEVVSERYHYAHALADGTFDVRVGITSEEAKRLNVSTKQEQRLRIIIQEVKE